MSKSVWNTPSPAFNTVKMAWVVGLGIAGWSGAKPAARGASAARRRVMVSQSISGKWRRTARARKAGTCWARDTAMTATLAGTANHWHGSTSESTESGLEGPESH